jgi:hypothetical protein
VGWGFVRFLSKNNAKRNNSGVLISLFTWLISILIALFPSEPPLKAKLVRLYFTKQAEQIDFNKKYTAQYTESREQLKMIFALDNSGDGLKDSIRSKDLQEKYEKYCIEIKNFFTHEALSYDLRRRLDNYKKCTYGDLLKARLCFDLIHNGGEKRQFCILKIGTSDSPIKFKYGGYDFASKKNIKDAIEDIYKTHNGKDDWTNFENFLAEIKAKMERKDGEKDKLSTYKDKLSTYTVYAYSDFYHNIEGEEKETDIRAIKTDKVNLFQNAVLNCIIDSHKREKGNQRTGRNILDGMAVKYYEHHFLIHNITADTILPSSIVLTKDRPFWFYSDDPKTHTTTSMQFMFEKSGSSICLFDDISGFSYVYGAHEKKLHKKEWINLKTENTVAISYKGNKPPDTAMFEIVCDDVHYFLECKFVKEINQTWRWIIIILCVGLGIGLGYLSFRSTKKAAQN